MNLMKNFLRQPPTYYFSKTRTDKVRYPIRTYGLIYDMIFSTLLSLLERPINVLEIGVSLFGVGSGHAFSNMPYVEKFVGIDKDDLKTPFPGNKSIFIKANAYTTDGFLQAKEHSPYDLIIDDSTHKIGDQIKFFKEYRKLANPISMMLCEDVQWNISDMIRREVKDDKLHSIGVPYFKHQYDDREGHLLLRIDYGKSRKYPNT